jgi:AcrR family transcriptional regulator
VPDEPTRASPTRRRTREAIVEAAIATWVRDRDATLDDIAQAAETHRATLHRHFRNRTELVDAAVARCVDDLVAATASAAVDDGPPLEALRRIVAGYFAIGDRIRFLFEDLGIARHPAVAELAAAEGPVVDLIRRGQADGAIDPRSSPAWIERAIWALVYAASEAVDDATLPAHGSLAVLLRTIEGGIGAAGTVAGTDELRQ